MCKEPVTSHLARVKGVLERLSMPPATITLLWPRDSCAAARLIALRPLAHTWDQRHMQCTV